MSQASPVGVEIRRYPTVQAFQADATSMSGAGWTVAAQTEVTGKFPVAAVILALIGIFVAVLFSILVGAAIVVIGVLVGMASRGKELVVTYKPPA